MTSSWPPRSTNIPDAPVSSFTLKIDWILAISGDKIDICAVTQKALREVDGHNNASADRELVVKTPDCRLRIASASHPAEALVLKVGGLGAGKVTVSGHGIKKTTRTVTSSTLATIKPVLTKATRNRLAARRDVDVKVKVAYTPAGGKTVIVSKTLTIHAARGGKSSATARSMITTWYWFVA